MVLNCVWHCFNCKERVDWSTERLKKVSIMQGLLTEKTCSQDILSVYFKHSLLHV